MEGIAYIGRIVLSLYCSMIPPATLPPPASKPGMDLSLEAAIYNLAETALRCGEPRPSKPEKIFHEYILPDWDDDVEPFFIFVDGGQFSPADGKVGVNDGFKLNFGDNDGVRTSQLEGYSQYMNSEQKQKIRKVIPLILEKVPAWCKR